MSLPVASSMPACSDMALSCPAWAKDPVAFGSYRALRGSQSHFQVQLELRDWTAHGQDSSNPFIGYSPSVSLCSTSNTFYLTSNCCLTLTFYQPVFIVRPTGSGILDNVSQSSGGRREPLTCRICQVLWCETPPPWLIAC